jgi:hypothetical protein
MLTISISLRRTILGSFVAAAILLPSLWIAGRLLHPPVPDLDHRSVLGKSGPWGQLEYRTITLEMPSEFAYIPPYNATPGPWVFPKRTKTSATEALRTIGLAPAALEALLKLSWTEKPDGCQVVPDDNWVLALPPDTRSQIYQTLITRNEAEAFYVFNFDADRIDQILMNSGLRPESLNLLKTLLYPKNKDIQSFADTTLAMRRLLDDNERRRFIQVLSRKDSLLVRLKLTPDADIGAVVNYWGASGMKRKVEALLNALYRADGGGELQIACLLPTFPRTRLYAFPSYADASFTVAPHDCAWSAMNFFNEVPDEQFSNATYIQNKLTADYYQIYNPSQVGDVVFLTRKNGTVVHAASYIADDIVFTKNGGNFTQPWIFMHLQDLVDYYANDGKESEPINTVYYRRKN